MLKPAPGRPAVQAASNRETVVSDGSEMGGPAMTQPSLPTGHEHPGTTVDHPRLKARAWRQPGCVPHRHSLFSTCV
jgi:hypothetical protein